MTAQSSAHEVNNHVEEVLQLLDVGKSAELEEFLYEMHPVELTNLISAMEENHQAELLKHVTGLDQLSAIITQAGDEVRKTALGLIDDSRIAAVIRRQEVDDAADVIGALPRRRQVKVLRRLGASRVKEITSLLAYDQDTAGGIMTTRYLSFSRELTAGEAISKLLEQLRESAISDDTDLYCAYVTSPHQVLEGTISVRELLSANPEKRLEEIMNTALIFVYPNADREQAARLIADYDISAIPVLEEGSSVLLGIITVDDVLDVIEEEHTEDLLKLAGTEDQDTVSATMLVAVRSRLPWLLASWLGGIAGAMLVGHFSPLLEKAVALASFMPVVFGMGGNVGSQSSTITVRGIATGDLGESRFFNRIRRELGVGSVLGLTFGVLLFVVSYLIYRDLRLSVIIGSSIVVTMGCASAWGSIIPVVFRRLGYDPAVSSGPLVTTSTDILSIVVYFTIAALFL